VRYGAGDEVTVLGQYAGRAHSIERIEFADGTVIDKAALDALPVAPITGTEGDDTLAGQASDDTLAGGAGADTYPLYLGMGSDTIVDASASPAEASTLALAEGLSLDSLKAKRARETGERFEQTVNRLKGVAKILFIAHQLPRELAVDSVHRLKSNAWPHQGLVEGRT
jgi:Ca2+-binding RTX toxin-like protein